jgi:hypothetical protein
MTSLWKKKIAKITKLMLCHRAVWRLWARFMSFDVSLHYDRSALSTTFLRMQLDYMPPLVYYMYNFFFLYSAGGCLSTQRRRHKRLRLSFIHLSSSYIYELLLDISQTLLLCVYRWYSFLIPTFWMFFISLWLLYTDNKLPLYSGLGAARWLRQVSARISCLFCAPSGSCKPPDLAACFFFA